MANTVVRVDIKTDDDVRVVEVVEVVDTGRVQPEDSPLPLLPCQGDSVPGKDGQVLGHLDREGGILAALLQLDSLSFKSILNT